jgi:hypothetical protein
MKSKMNKIYLMNNKIKTKYKKFKLIEFLNNSKYLNNLALNLKIKLYLKMKAKRNKKNSTNI